MTTTHLKPSTPPAARIRREVDVTMRLGGPVVPARLITFHGLVDGREHLAIGLGDVGRRGSVPLVRPHSECLTGDVLGSERCDCGPQLREAVARISAAGGYLLYLRQEGRGIGLYDKLDAYALQDQGLDTYDANLALGHAPDERDYTVAAQMLHALGVREISLLSNNPDKRAQLLANGIAIAEQIPTGFHVSDSNVRYLSTKNERFGHTMLEAPMRERDVRR
jgi:GTP cyclohydrolase II